MLRLTTALFIIAPTGAALAHEGLHHHPHGSEYGWIAALVVGAVGGYLLARLGWRK